MIIARTLEGVSKKYSRGLKINHFFVGEGEYLSRWIEAPLLLAKPMRKAPALIVRHRRMTLVIGVLLACLMVIAAICVSIGLYLADATLAIVLVPQIFVLIAVGLLKLAYDRWATSTVCLCVSADGLLLPGMSTRRIPWIDVRSVRCISSTPTPEHATKPRHYLLLEADVPAVSRSQPGLLWWRAQQLVFDVSQLDASRDAILEAFYRFHPAAVADAEVASAQTAAAKSDGERPRLPMAATIRLCAQHIRAKSAPLLAAQDMWSDAVVTWHRLALQVRREAQLVMLGAAIVRRTTVSYAQRLVRIARDVTLTNLARGQRSARVAAVAVRHRFVRSV